jgi:hypothetical protein
MYLRLHSLALLVTLAAGCTGSGESSTSSSNAISSSEATLDAASVSAAIAKLTHQRTGDPIGTYYTDGSRLEGCWLNPAGSKLTDLKKAFYCSMPLEFRLCNTIVLLTTDDSKVDERYQGYLDCQKKVDGALGGNGLFVYDAGVNSMYKQLFLEGATLAADDTTRVVAANKPTFSGRSFPTLLLAIGESVATEATDLAWSALSSMVDDFKTALKRDPA